jgi:hypothetical protein
MDSGGGYVIVDSAEQQDAATAEHPEDIQWQNRRLKVN